MLRRTLFLFAALLISSRVVSSGQSTAPTPNSAPQYLVYVGTYTDKTNSKGIYAYRYDPATGKMTLLGVAAETPNPSFLAVHPNGQFLYAVNESGKASTVSAFRIDAASGKLALLNQVPALGEDPCYISFDRAGKFVFVANYTSGNMVVFPITADGKLRPATGNLHDEGKLGPNKERQEFAHAHWVELTSGDRLAYVADLGLDAVLVYRFDPSNTRYDRPMLSFAGVPPNTDRVTVPPGTGPRHVALSRDGKNMYVLGELQSTVTVFGRSDSDHPFRQMQQLSALPEGFSGRNDAAEIVIDAGGKHLYSSNRGHESIAVFNIQESDGALTLAANVPTGGKEPRHFALDPNGRFLLAENQLSDNIVEFRVDPSTGGLVPTGDSVGIPSPVCLVFVPVK